MYDYVNYECECPTCHAKVDNFQTKDGDRVLRRVEPEDVEQFYAICDQCKCWIEFNRDEKSGEYIMTVESKGGMY